MTALSAAAVAAGKPTVHLTPECATGQIYPDWPHGCPDCKYPGSEHPHLGWVDVQCGCRHHTEEATS